jgi:hypothetical protein
VISTLLALQCFYAPLIEALRGQDFQYDVCECDLAFYLQSAHGNPDLSRLDKAAGFRQNIVRHLRLMGLDAVMSSLQPVEHEIEHSGDTHAVSDLGGTLQGCRDSACLGEGGSVKTHWRRAAFEETSHRLARMIMMSHGLRPDDVSVRDVMGNVSARPSRTRGPRGGAGVICDKSALALAFRARAAS